MKKAKKLLALVISVLMLVSVLAACAGGDTTDTKTTDTKTTDTKVTDDGKLDKEIAKTEVSETAKTEGWTPADCTESLVAHVASSVNFLDSFSGTSNDAGGALSAMLFDPLVKKDDEGNLIPWAAESWEMAADSMSCTFKLRDDIYFTDGTKATAEDEKFALERIRDDVEHLPESSTKNQRPFLGEITCPDELTLVVNFTKVWPQFWNYITGPNMGLMSKAAYEKMGYDKFWEHPVGTTPYVVESWDAANCIGKFTLRSDGNEWFGFKLRGWYTNVKDVTIQSSAEGQTRIASLKTGEVDIIDYVPTADVVELDKAGFSVNLLTPSNCVFLQTACGAGDSFEDQKLREALSLCIDRELLVDTLIDGYGAPCDFACTIANLGRSAYSEDLAIKYDPARAKELVDASDYDGSPLDFIFTTSTVNFGVELTQAIQSMASQAGLNLSLRMLETAVYDDARANRDFDIVLANIGGVQNDNYLLVNNVTGNDKFNTGFQNDELKELALKTGLTSDRDELEEIYASCYKVIMKEFYPAIYVCWPQNITVTQSYVSGLAWEGGTTLKLTDVVKSK